MFDKLLDHLVGGHKQGLRNVEAEGLGSLQVDGKLDPCRLLHWEISRLLALYNAPRVAADQMQVARVTSGRGLDKSLTADSSGCIILSERSSPEHLGNRRPMRRLRACGSEGILAPDSLERRLTAILAADVAGYSRLIGLDEEGTHVQLREHLSSIVSPRIAYRLIPADGDPAKWESDGHSYLTSEDADRSARLSLAAKLLR
jgi:hypothetical protein